MRCIFCNERVIRRDKNHRPPITLPSRGIAHSDCAEEDLMARRIFGILHIDELTDDDLYELRELVQLEINDRAGLGGNETEFF